MDGWDKESMTPEQALHILDQTAAEAPVNRAAHAQAIQCVSFLQNFIKKNTVTSSESNNVKVQEDDK